MTSDNTHPGRKPESRHDGGDVDEPAPEWANGLRQLYDSVVDEPLPDSFKDILAKLDEDGDDGAGEASDSASRGGKS